jgi:hypothetical protein
MTRLEIKEVSMKKLAPIISMTLISILTIAISPSILQPASPQKNAICCLPVFLAPIAVSGNDIYTAWTNATSTTLHSAPVFFTKSNDGGNTFAKTMIISSPNKNAKILVINENISISASGNNVAVSWWTNKTGIFNPVIRISNDGGNTFANIIRLNSTAGGTNK